MIQSYDSVHPYLYTYLFVIFHFVFFDFVAAFDQSRPEIWRNPWIKGDWKSQDPRQFSVWRCLLFRFNQTVPVKLKRRFIYFNLKSFFQLQYASFIDKGERNSEGKRIMQMKKKGNTDAPPKQKERHIVTWSQQVDSLSSALVMNLLEKFSVGFFVLLTWVVLGCRRMTFSASKLASMVLGINVCPRSNLSCNQLQF